MTVPRFFIPAHAIDTRNGKIVWQDERLAKQISNVLRLRVGDKVNILDGLGSIYFCRLEKAGKGQLKASIEESLKIEEGTGIPVHIALPLLKSGRFEWALEKLTELGVAKISPIVVKRSVVQAEASTGPIDSASSKMNRWKAILKEASEQCERATIPLLVPPCNFETFVSETASSAGPVKIICAERREAPHLATMLGNRNVSQLKEVVIAVGAEGGFTDGEVELAISSHFVAVSLGRQILRSETAAIYALAIVASQCAAKE
jgi:16S rRNA (uracil1498-N3)-methyltransferase